MAAVEGTCTNLLLLELHCMIRLLHARTAQFMHSIQQRCIIGILHLHCSDTHTVFKYNSWHCPSYESSKVGCNSEVHANAIHDDARAGCCGTQYTRIGACTHNPSTYEER
jgi:hypothetical protein